MSSAAKGFVAIYRWRVDPANEPAFRERWKRATVRLRDEGGCGSLLGRGADGFLVAIALWPDAATREAAFDRTTDDDESWPQAERLEPILVEPLENLWDMAAWQETSSD